MRLKNAIVNLVDSGPLMREASASGNLKVLASLLGPAFRGLILQRGKHTQNTVMDATAPADYLWTYERAHPRLRKLYEIAKRDQWNSSTDIDWSVDVDPQNSDVTLIPDSFLPMAEHPLFQKLNKKEKNEQRHAVLAWLLSQFLHGEQGALFAAAQVTTSVPWMDAKLYGSTQVVDEGRHVEVFHRYLDDKLNKMYAINDNLYVIIDLLMRDGRWDMKFLGMQIMIEGLALGAFGTIRSVSQEPLLCELLSYVIADEARHVQYGVVALSEYYGQVGGMSARERREREDWVFELALLMRNRFLAHECYDEYWAHAMGRREWDAMLQESALMRLFRETMFKRIVPNIKRIGLLSDRVRPWYAEMGLLSYEHEPAATDLSARDLAASLT